MPRLSKPHQRTEGYASLVERFGEGRVADALLAKWLSDEGANHKWEDLWVDTVVGRAVTGVWAEIDKQGLSEKRPRKVLPVERIAHLRRRVLLWHLSNGKDVIGAAEEMGIPFETAKDYLRKFKREHKLSKRDYGNTATVAYALREGLIP
jgi:hypothetical protein